MMDYSIWIGWDPREAAAFAVARESCKKHLNIPIPIHGLVLDDLIKAGLYKRPIEYRTVGDKSVMWDIVSDAPMSTEHANARFFVPKLAENGWALFVDGDVMFRGNVRLLFEQLDPAKAVYCVQHRHEPANTVKMDGQKQTVYPRKNWTSVLAWNCDHPANKALTFKVLNETPGRDLHRLFWLDDNDIGELDPVWNFLVGYTDPAISPTIAHFTDGVPDMQGYHDVPFADEWRMFRNNWARGRSFNFQVPKWGSGTN